MAYREAAALPIEFVCVVCYRRCAATAGDCAGCGVPMVAVGSELGPEILRELKTRAQAIVDQPERRRFWAWLLSSLVLAVGTYVVLLVCRVVDVDTRRHGHIGGIGALWVPWVLWGGFAVAVAGVLRLMSANQQTFDPASAGVDELARFLSLDGQK